MSFLSNTNSINTNNINSMQISQQNNNNKNIEYSDINEKQINYAINLFILHGIFTSFEIRTKNL
jgi:hypothetical protein